MREFRVSVDIDASPEAVWPVVADVFRWAEWTPTILSVEALQPGPLGPGARVKIRQPKLLPAVWTITDWQPGRGFTWVARQAGLRMEARHEISPTPEGCRVELVVAMRGWLAGLVATLFGKLSGNYLEIEAAGLKRRCENGR